MVRKLGLVTAMWFALAARGTAVRGVTAVGSDPSGYVRGQVVVKLRADVGKPVARPAANALAARFGQAAVRSLLPEVLAARGVHGSLDAIYVFDYGKDADVPALARQIAADSAVLYAEPNYICQAMITPNDPYYPTTGAWGQSFPDMWGLHRIGLNPVGAGSGWDYETGQSNPVLVAVVDTGVDATHSDIAGKIWTNANEIPDNGLDDDNNGYIDDVHGWDFVNNDNDPHDGHGHGTHCSGTIAAMTDNNLGVAGISWGATIMPVKGLSDGGSGSSTGLASAVIYAADNGAKVLSNSWGGEAAGDPQVLHDAFIYATNHGSLCVAAAGNSGNDLYPPFPARYEEVLVVAGTAPTDLKASFSNYGSFIDVSAPGVDILSLRAAGTDMYGNGEHIVGTEYYRASGTSMACPHVAGVAALVWSQHPDWTADQIREQIEHTSDDIDPLNLECMGELGWGRANARWALSMLPRPLVRFRELQVTDSGTANPNGAADPGETVSLLVTLRNSWLPASNVTATLTSADANISIDDGMAVYGPISEGELASNSSDAFSIAVSPSCPLGYVASLSLDIDADGHTWTDQVTLTVASPDLELRGYLVLDPGGDRDRRLDAGEACGLVLRLANGVHGAVARSITATVSTTDAYLTIEQATASYDDIGPNAVGLNSTQPFAITLAPTFPADHVAVVQVAVTGEGFSDSFSLDLTLPGIHREISDYVLIPDPFGPPNPDCLNVAIDAQDRIHVAWDHPDADIGPIIVHREWDTGLWLPREHVAGSGWSNVGGNQLLLDAAGAPRLSWNQAIVIDAGGFGLVARGIYYRNRQVGWGPVKNVSNRPGTLENGMANAMAVDRDGNAHIVWLFTHYNEGGGFVDQPLYHSRQVNGVWQPEEAIAVNALALSYYEMTLLPTTDGRLWLLYRKYETSFPIAYRVWDGATWSDETLVPVSGQLASVFAAAIDGQNRVHVFFRNYENPAHLWYTKCEGGTWSGIVEPPAVPGSQTLMCPHVYVDRSDNLYLLYVVRTKPESRTVDQIYTWRQQNGSWIGPEALTSFPPDASRYLLDLAMVVDSTGRRHLFYVEADKGVFHCLAGSVAVPPPVRPAVGTLIFQDGRQYLGGTIYTGTRDTHLIESVPVNNSGGSIALEIGRQNGADALTDRSTVIAFTDLEVNTEAGKVLRQATVTLNYFGSRGDPGNVRKTLSIHQLLHDWGEGDSTGLDGAAAGDGEACWSKPFGTSGGDNPEWSGALLGEFASPTALDSVTLGSIADYGPVSFDVTEAVRDQLLGRIPNYGFVVRETPGGESDQDGTRQFDASEATDISVRPSLTLVFGAAAPGDFDLDSDVDLVDFGHLQACLTGLTVPQTDPACQDAKLDNDDDVDQADAAILLECLSGPNVSADPNCAD